MQRPTSLSKDLPPRKLRRKKTKLSGKEWISYYYNGRDLDGRRVELGLGEDLNEAKRKWAELECKPTPRQTGSTTMLRRAHRPTTGNSRVSHFYTDGGLGPRLVASKHCVDFGGANGKRIQPRTVAYRRRK
jgi:hypothetical protein